MSNLSSETTPAWVGQLAECIADSLVSALADRPAIVPLQVKRSDAATLAGVSPATWDAMTAAGENPAPSYIGRIPFWRVKDMEAWILAGCPNRNE